MNRNAFSLGRSNLAMMQKSLRYPPKRKVIPKLVNRLVKDSGLKGANSEYYFRLMAIVALSGRDAMHFNFKSRRKHVA